MDFSLEFGMTRRRGTDDGIGLIRQIGRMEVINEMDPSEIPQDDNFGDVWI
jgi:hypothetical protein